MIIAGKKFEPALKAIIKKLSAPPMQIWQRRGLATARFFQRIDKNTHKIEEAAACSYGALVAWASPAGDVSLRRICYAIIRLLAAFCSEPQLERNYRGK
jgi:hypothetical protein